MVLTTNALRMQEKYRAQEPALMLKDFGQGQIASYAVEGVATLVKKVL